MRQPTTIWSDSASGTSRPTASASATASCAIKHLLLTYDHMTYDFRLRNRNGDERFLSREGREGRVTDGLLTNVTDRGRATHLLLASTAATRCPDPAGLEQRHLLTGSLWTSSLASSPLLGCIRATRVSGFLICSRVAMGTKRRPYPRFLCARASCNYVRATTASQQTSLPLFATQPRLFA